MGERLITAANSMRSDHQAIFTSTRFGNVLGSRGSVVEVFRRQVEAGGPITITDPSMTRFVMSPRQAVDLVLSSATLARGGEVFVTKMQNLRIADLAEVMVDLLAPHSGRNPGDIETLFLGSRPGEKFYEELLNEEETRRTIELADHFVVLPAFRYIYDTIDYDYPDIVRDQVDRVYRSDREALMPHEEIRRFLIDNELVPLRATMPMARGSLANERKRT
jgi:FlaA1/EpsC-like NDP-sugar epimerase